MRVSEILREDFTLDSSAGNWMQKHPDAYIHFTNVEKLGVNPNKVHGDVYGIYFYPVKFFLDKQNALKQYGMDMKYFFVADIDKSTNGVNLATVTKEEVRAIAERNGWGETFEGVRRDPTVFLERAGVGLRGSKAARLIEERHPGAIFYCVPWHMVNNPELWDLPAKPNFRKMFDGVDYIEDPGMSIVHPNEPNQLIVLNPKAIAKVHHVGEVNYNHVHGLGKRLAAWLKMEGFEVRYHRKQLIAEKRHDPYFKLTYQYLNGNQHYAPAVLYTYFDKETGRERVGSLGLSDAFAKPVVIDVESQTYDLDALKVHVRAWMDKAAEATDDMLLWAEVKHRFDHVMTYSPGIDVYRSDSFADYLRAVCKRIDGLERADIPTVVMRKDIDVGIPGVPTELVRKLYANWAMKLEPRDITASPALQALSTVVTNQLSSGLETFDDGTPEAQAAIQSYQTVLAPRTDKYEFYTMLANEVVEYGRRRYQRRMGDAISETDFEVKVRSFLRGSVLAA